MRLDRWALRELSGFGLLRFLNQASGQVVFQLDRLLLAAFLPIRAVTLYSVPLTIAQKFTVIQFIFSGAFFPAASELHAIGDRERLRRLYLASMKLSVVMVVPLVVLVAGFAHAILSTWIGPAFAVASTNVLIVLAIAYGFATLIGVPALASDATGHAHWTVAFATASAAGNVLLLLGIGFLAIGLAFKASAAPFHMWTPDVYEGAPTIVTTFMSVATKSAAFAAIGRVFIAAFPAISSRWYVPLSIIAILSLIVGNLVAITQDNLKRMLAYSGIAHAGFILLGILPGTTQGFGATLFYIAAYAVMNFGAFAVVTSVGAAGEETADINYWRGLFHRRPFLATVMTIFMLSLAGIPPTVGFFAKLFVFRALVDAQIWLPLAVAIVMTIVSFYYYLRVIVVMLAAPPEGAVERQRVGISMGTVLAVSAAGTMLLGFFPSFVLDWANRAASLHL
jgi:NADH-quinone oxidoreductase subunit N